MQSQGLLPDSPGRVAVCEDVGRSWLQSLGCGEGLRGVGGAASVCLQGRGPGCLPISFLPPKPCVLKTKVSIIPG